MEYQILEISWIPNWLLVGNTNRKSVIGTSPFHPRCCAEHGITATIYEIGCLVVIGKWSRLYNQITHSARIKQTSKLFSGVILTSLFTVFSSTTNMLRLRGVRLFSFPAYTLWIISNSTVSLIFYKIKQNPIAATFLTSSFISSKPRFDKAFITWSSPMVFTLSFSAWSVSSIAKWLINAFPHSCIFSVNNTQLAYQFHKGLAHFDLIS